MVISAPLTIRGHPAIFVPGDLMSAHSLAGAAEVTVSRGCSRTPDPRRAEVGERPAAERGTSASVDAVRPLRYRDLGLAACISIVARGLHRVHSDEFAGWPGSRSGSLSGSQRPPPSSHTQPHQTS